MGTHLTWRSYLQSRTRRPDFLWRMVLAILAGGAVVGLAVDWAVPAWIDPLEDTESSRKDEESEPEDSVFEILDDAARRGDWPFVWRTIPRSMLQMWKSAGPTVLALLTGGCWLAFCLQAVQVRSWRDHRLWGALLAVLLGVLSIWPTLFLVYWQEYEWGLAESDDLAAGLRFFILGVGLREESAKFLCVLPLLPWIVRARDELAALMLSACVGVGFAMEENILYISGSGGSATLTRLLMPAPFHMAMTGLIGLAAYRAVRWPRSWGPQFFAVFGVIVFAHGLYDAMSLPALAEYGILSYIIFALTCYQFFRELRMLRTTSSSVISLTANFLCCVSLVASATFVYLSAAMGFGSAADIMVNAILAQAVMVYLFLREMPDSMVTV